jgi:apolipoprotein N-acyltransferase
VAWLPLLWVEEKVHKNPIFLGLTYLHMLVWNGLTTWWIWYASAPGAIAAIAANSLLMCLPWLGYRICKKRMGVGWGSLALITGWMAFEYLHLQDWGLSWPWLTLGNGLASYPEWIQWYEYTGTSGGTLWILGVNLLLFLHFRQAYANAEISRRPYRWITLALLIIPLALSKWMDAALRNITATNKTQEVALLQPNIDPYEKVSSYASFDQQLQDLIRKSEAGITENTELLLWPETALYRGGGISEMDLSSKSALLDSLWAFLRRHPKLTLFTGVESYSIVANRSPNSYPVPNWLRVPGDNRPLFIEAYNGAALLDSNGANGFYHKSKLVPGVETLPRFLRFLDSWFEEFGGTTGGYTPQAERNVLANRNGFRLAPAICYESIYGEHLGRYFRNGANLLAIITNDGWWQNTPGHKQHWLYARLRAIETRHWVARSANTGISGFIHPSGYWTSQQPYGTSACLLQSIPVEQNEETFFVQHGDILSRIALALYGVLWIWMLATRLRKENA